MDNWCLATGAPTPEAYVFINHTLCPDAALRSVDTTSAPRA
ncbi:hypothetical protein [Brevibacterium sp. p3-SID960]|nr:hypothetical protein [Brevibacterium sp. p3-SID960]